MQLGVRQGVLQLVLQMDCQVNRLIAFRLMQATEAAAAAAANAASQAVSALSGGSSGSMQHGGENRAEWYKVLPKPQNFEPKDREQELSGFGRLVLELGAIHCCSG